MATLYALLLLEENERQDRIFRNRFDAFSLEDESFKHLFRLSKYVTRNLCSKLREELQPIGVGRSLSVETQVLCSLRFFATGSYQRAVAQDLMLALSQASVSRCIKKVADAMNKLMLHEEVHFPSVSSYPAIKKKFFDGSNFPGVIGAIDCTHVAIIAPPAPLEDCYINRKGYHSINVQLVCDTDLKILNVNAKHAGRTHDAFIWRNSNLRAILESESAADEHRSWLVGDSGYPLESFLMTPFLNPANPQEQRYNTAHVRARICIERCNGVLKGRFRCLHKHRTLNYNPTVASKIINSCVILHNLCIKYRIQYEEIDDDSDDSDGDDDGEDFVDSSTNNNVRSRIVKSHFS